MKSKHQTGRKFTARDVASIISNPVYAGVGIYPAIVPEELWIGAAIVAIKQQGANFWLGVQTNISNSLDLPADETITLCRRFQSVYEAVDQDELRVFTLKGFLHDLRLLAAA
jgi:hypothetical protein